MAEPRLFVISPHFDDAVLSCGAMLDGGVRATVVTVCGGVPEPGAKLSAWDRICGFGSAEAAALGRRAEDEAACAQAGAEAVRLPFPDGPYAAAGREGVAEALREVLAGLSPSDRVAVPAGIGRHPDHVMARDLALRACRENSCGLLLYADVPYACDPSWEAADEDRPPRRRWGPAIEAVRALGHDVDPPQVRRLGPEEAARKTALAAHYRSQTNVFLWRHPALLDADGVLSTEVSWSLTRRARD